MKRVPRNILRKFTTLHSRLRQRRERLLQELALLDRTLALPPHVIQKPRAKRPHYHCPERAYGALTQAVKDALANGPRTKREVLAALERSGVPLGGAPLEVVDSVIYTRHFKRDGQLFALAKPQHA